VSRSAWANFRPPEWVDREAFLFCGADPAWTPEKEYRRQDAPDAAPGKCSLCEDGDPTVCARCRRYGRQHLIDGAPARLAPERGTAAAATEKASNDKAETSGRVPPPPAAAASLVVVCTEHDDCVRRGDIHVPTKFAAMLERD
jgi:hypothetical protein